MQTTMAFRSCNLRAGVSARPGLKRSAKLCVRAFRETKEETKPKQTWNTTSDSTQHKDNSTYKEDGINPADTAQLLVDVGKGDLKQAQADFKEQVDRSLFPRAEELKEASDPGFMQAQGKGDTVACWCRMFCLVRHAKTRHTSCGQQVCAAFILLLRCIKNCLFALQFVTTLHSLCIPSLRSTCTSVSDRCYNVFSLQMPLYLPVLVQSLSTAVWLCWASPLALQLS